MPFDRSMRNPHLVGPHLIVNYEGRDLNLNLNTCLSNVNGRFQWGGKEALSTAKGISLSGSMLSSELQQQGGRSIEAEIDLSQRIKVVSGRLQYVADAPPRPPVVLTAPALSPSPTLTAVDSPPSYDATFSQEYSEFKSAHKTTYSERSSSYFKFSLKDKPLRLVGSVVHAECRRAGQQGFMSSQLDLDLYIGVVDGKLVWGRTKFFTQCQNISLDKFILRADCKNDSGTTVKSTLDLSRYLQTYDGFLGVKVAIASTELSELFSEARWMKFKVVTEADSAGVLGALGEQAAFKTAFSALATTTSQHVVAEMTQELSAAAGQYVKDAVTDTVKAEMTEIVSDAITARVRGEITKKVDEVFAVARESILTACNDMVDAAANDVTLKYTQSIIGPMEEKIMAGCNNLIQHTLTEVSASAIAQFQERAEILMEREIVGASIRRAETQAALLKMLAATLS
ncbi:hypothetical protein BDP27DRAFT_1451368 [Rhodocollybia butyracea]|uniref:Cyanovirin-N domain-containing protein n=1 Tax=Rhodocollybia butyracea TaxID=206335 RepID=A0A9P5PH36_9AGAR|nr:hypothetical protein BDP27DRAFT_1451368 [Rhodocollybia butyracea]